MNAVPALNQFDPANPAAHYKAVRLRLGAISLANPVTIPPRPKSPCIVTEIDGYKPIEPVQMKPLVEHLAANPITVALIIQAVAVWYGITTREIKGPRKPKSIVFPRHIAYWLCKNAFPHYSLPQIGRLFGGRDHTTILHGVGKIDRMLAEGSLTIPEPLLALTKPVGVEG